MTDDQSPTTNCPSLLLRSSIIKGPGFRNDLDVRRVWQCPACGLTQRLMQDVTSARCGCVRDGVPMKLAEEPRSPRIALRADARAVIDRIQAGEVIPRLFSALGTSRSSDGESVDTADDFDEEGNRRSTRRPERQEADRPPRQENDRPPRQDSDRPARGEKRNPSNGPRDSGPRTDRRDAQPEVNLESSTTAEPVIVPVEAIHGSAPVAVPPAEVTASPTNQNSTPIVAANDDHDDFAAGLDDEVR